MSFDTFSQDETICGWMLVSTAVQQSIEQSIYVVHINCASWQNEMIGTFSNAVEAPVKRVHCPKGATWQCASLA